jgi:hypothetical protein
MVLTPWYSLVVKVMAKIAVKRMMDLPFWDIQCIPMPMVEEDIVI